MRTYLVTLMCNKRPVTRLVNGRNAFDAQQNAITFVQKNPREYTYANNRGFLIELIDIKFIEELVKTESLD